MCDLYLSLEIEICMFLDLSAHLERIGTELTQSRSNWGSPHLANGHSNESSERSLDLPPGSIVDPHQQLLMVLSNVGYCKDELCYELYNKYKHIWSHSRLVNFTRTLLSLLSSYLESFCVYSNNILYSMLSVSGHIKVRVSWQSLQCATQLYLRCRDLFETRTIKNYSSFKNRNYVLNFLSNFY